LTDPVTVELRNEESLLAGVEDPEVFYLEVLQRYKLDAYEKYLSERTAWSDLQVLWQTLMAVFLSGRAPAPSVEEIRARVEEDHGIQS
jgi:lipopolysaccharide/colanic/teichoic acid biosynthesis glycosyltransferase